MCSLNMTTKLFDAQHLVEYRKTEYFPVHKFSRFRLKNMRINIYVFFNFHGPLYLRTKIITAN